MIHSFRQYALLLTSIIIFLSCSSPASHEESQDNPEANAPNDKNTTYPSDLLPSHEQWSIRMGDGEVYDDLKNLKDDKFFYTANDGKDWIVYKTPNSGVTSPNSNNTRTELGQKEPWLPQTGGRLTGTLKVMQVSTSGDARVASSFSVVVGQIHGREGHENEPLKIFYKKFPDHTKGAVYWNYEINTEGDNSGRWDYSTEVWGYDMSLIGSAPDSYPAEPEDGIALGEEFSYEINVYEGIMYLTFSSDGHQTKTFTKSLLVSEFVKSSDIPQQIITLYTVIGRDGTEKPMAYAGELQNFKQGAYNQTNGKAPETNMVWSSGAETFGGDIAKQYANGSYAEVWFRNTVIGPGVAPNK